MVCTYAFEQNMFSFTAIPSKGTIYSESTVENPQEPDAGRLRANIFTHAAHIQEEHINYTGS